jgi:membrane-bound lytic murein transglycosylase D
MQRDDHGNPTNDTPDHERRVAASVSTPGQQDGAVGEAPADAQRAPDGDARSWEDRLVGLRREVGSFSKQHRAPLSLGLAASSLALIAGTTGKSSEAQPEAASVLGPLSETEEAPTPTWDLTVSEHDRIDFFVEFLMGRNYDKTKLWLERLGKYGPFIQNELRERGMPQDLIWLATIESGLDNNAYSRAHAAGMWQFIEETGKRYGLEVSRFVDERRDPIKATAAALTYLQEMHDRFDSWYLASAGYNTGENRVGRLMRETTGSERGTDEGYWSIWDRLPRETRDYVPLMIAMGHIGKEPAQHGFTDLQLQEPLQFEEVIVPGGTKLTDVANLTGAELEEIKELNARFLRGQTPPGRDMAVRVPIGSGQQLIASIGGTMGTQFMAE